MTENSFYSPCFLCPRLCGAARDSAVSVCKMHGTSSYCGESTELRLACASIHRGEEPPITGSEGENAGGGSGTIFVSGCNLGCVFCQNYQISAGNMGRTVDTAEFARICLMLQEKGAENINIVTGSHAVPAIVNGIAAAKNRGLTIPVLWNSSGYELPSTLEMLADTVDVFLPDMKTLDSSITQRYCNAPDYPSVASAAIKKMLDMRKLRFRGSKIVSGLIIRHLVLPGYIEASREVLRWFAGSYSGQALLSLMFQYTPVVFSGSVMPGGQPDRYITEDEYNTVLDWLVEFGIEDGYCQELVPENTDWLPDFEKENPFPSDLSIPVWHWKHPCVTAPDA